MKTIRWFEVAIPDRLAANLGQSLLKNPYTENKGEGFSIKKLTQNEVIGTFIQSKSFIKEVHTPTGEVDTITGTDYSSIDFKFTLGNHPILEIYSKPRTLKPFITCMSSIVGFGFTIKSIDINLSDFIELLESDFGKIKITKIKITDLNIDNKALGLLILTSDNDIRKVIENRITLGRNYKIKYIKAHFISDSFYNGYIELDSTSGLVVYDMPYNKFISKFLETYFKFIFS